MRDRYDDGGFSGGSMERPALKKLLDAVRARRIDVIVVYKVDRLTRSLADFAKLVELFDEHQVSFVSVTQAFNTTTSMGRLGIVRVNSILPARTPGRVGAPLFLLTNCRRAWPDYTPKIAYTYLP